MADEPVVTFNPADEDCPYDLYVAVQHLNLPNMDIHRPLSPAVLRRLRQSMVTAEQEYRQSRLCLGDHHVFRVAEAQPLTPPGAVAVLCRNCPADGVLEANGDIVPVEGSGQ